MSALDEPPFDLGGLYQALDGKIRHALFLYRQGLEREGAPPAQLHALNRTRQMVSARATHAVLGGKPLPAKPTKVQVEHGLSEAYYKDLLPALYTGVEQGLHDLRLSLQPLYERYPGALVPPETDKVRL